MTGSLTFLVREYSVASQFNEEVNEAHFLDCFPYNFGFAGSGFSVLRPAICETIMLIS